MDSASWNQFIKEHEPRSGAFLQSWSWGEFQKSIGREVRHYETPNAIAQVVSHPLPGGMFGWNIYRGLIEGQETRDKKQENILETIISDLKNTKGIFLHIEPNQELQATSHKLQAVPNRQPEHTLIVDLRKHEETLMSEMHEKTRYNIKVAERHGVVVKENALPDDFLKLMSMTTTRDGFSAHPESYYRAMLKDSPDNKLFVAYGEGEPLAAAIVNFFGKTATYLHGASSNTKRNLMAPHLLHWQIMQSAKAGGYDFYDFWGIAPENEPNHAWAGITRFKKGFGGEIVIMPKALELPLRPVSYSIYKLIKRLRP